MLQQICSTKEESDILPLLRSVFNLIGMTTGLHEAKERIEREKRHRLEKTEGNNYNNNKNNNDNHYNYNRLLHNGTNCRVYNANLK